MSIPKNPELLMQVVLSDLKRRAQITKPLNEYQPNWDPETQTLSLVGQYTERTRISIRVKCSPGSVDAVTSLVRMNTAGSVTYNGAATYVVGDAVTGKGKTQDTPVTEKKKNEKKQVLEKTKAVVDTKPVEEIVPAAVESTVVSDVIVDPASVEEQNDEQQV